MIDININSSYPHTDEVYTNVLNKGGSKKINIAFFDDDIPLDLSSANVTATFVTNGFLIAEDIEVSKVENTDNIVTLDISSSRAYTLIPGKMLVEFKFTKNNEELYPATAMCIYVKSSIRDNAKILPESIGTVAEIIKEIIKARKDFNDLDARLNDIDDRIVEAVIPDKAVTRNKIADKAVSGDKIAVGTITSSNIGVGQVQEANIDGGAVTNNKLATNSVSTLKIQDEAVTEDKLADNAVTTDKISDGSVNTNKLADGAVTAGKIKNLSVSTAKLDNAAVKSEKIAYRQITENHLTDELKAVIPKVTVWDIQASIENNFTVPTTYAGKLGDIVVVTSLSVGSGGIIYQLTRTVTQLGNTRYYWTDISTDTSADKIQQTDYSIAFNADGLAYHVDTTGGVISADGAYTTAKTFYCAPNVTEVTSGFFSVATNLTDLYIDNEVGGIVLPSNIPATVNVHYKDDFKLSNLLVNSMVASNTKLLNLENTFNGLINGDEVAY
jgi:hypothetical protein